MRFKRIKTGIICFFTTLAFISPVNTYAADATVVFGSDSYTNESGAEFPIGVYIDGDSEIGFYHVEISYDPQRLEYVEGATSGGDGTVIFEGNGNNVQVSSMLRFRALSGGDTEISVKEAQVRVAGTEGESFEMTELARVPVSISGEDITATTAQTETAQSESNVQTEETQESETESTSAPGEASEGSGNLLGVVIPLVVGLGAALAAILIIIGIRSSKKRMKAERLEKAKVVGQKLRNTETNGLKEEVKAVRKSTGHEDSKRKVTALKTEKKYTNKEVPKEGAKTAVNENDLKKAKIAPESSDNTAKASSVKADDKSIGKTVVPPVVKSTGGDGLKKITDKPIQNKNLNSSVKEEEKGKPIIDVRNVSMEFKVTNSNASGLKDYAIQKMRGKLKTRKLKALDNISFKVFKGEVVGIIGSNGSGKSTLLKIVSGALRPTSGEVIADQSKIQLLTFGAGFDGELSAKENVYLNGAIIGYNKDFIDKHYNEIVEFAELHDFMDEKVKNFSSGMVSRLAFSIATVAGAAEILILDEVLAVGDQFFRKKSLKRVQQMIHGGSTVLIVSHSLHTIQTHCTKVVWIEKGVLKMVGEPKVVCEEYARSHNNEGDQTARRGMVKKVDDKIVYVKNGVIDNDFNGLATDDHGKLLYFKNGLFDDSFSWYLVRSPIDGKWVFVRNGEVDFTYTGLARSSLDGRWYYTKDGVLDKSYTNKLAKSPLNGKWYFVKNGHIDKSFTGLGQSPDSKWYYVKNGILDKSFTGVAVSSADGDLYYVQDGILNKNVSGEIAFGGKKYVIKNGKVANVADEK